MTQMHRFTKARASGSTGHAASKDAESMGGGQLPGVISSEPTMAIVPTETVGPAMASSPVPTATPEPSVGDSINVEPTATPTATVANTLAPESASVVGGESRVDPVVWVCVGVAIAALVAIVAVLLRRRRVKRPAAPDPTTERTEGYSADEPVTVADVDHGLIVGNAQHIGRRENQQDAFGVSDLAQRGTRGLLAVVADGMGGLSNGAEISTAVVRTILSGFVQLSPEVDPALRLLSLAGDAHRAALRIAANGGGGSTLLMAYVWRDKLYTLSVGDSRIYLLRGGVLTQLNREHVYSVELDERAALGEITFEEALADPQRKALTSYLGMAELSRFDRVIHPIQLCDGDRVALLSDGVFGTISESELLGLLKQDAYHAAVQIQEAVLLKNMAHQDNLTAVIIEYH